VKQLRSVDQKRLHREWQRRTDQRVALLLDAVQDPFNVGSIIRTAAALRVEHLYLAAHATRPTHPKVGKTAMGTERYLEWSEYERAGDAVAAARGDGFRVVALELADESSPLFELDLTGDVCVVLGNESRGLTEAVLAGCDAVGYLPLVGRVGSLNVAAAAAAALAEVRRQGWQSGEASRAGDGSHG
jgi:tRNA (guanosine-2'-O-)-methyltransferase